MCVHAREKVTKVSWINSIIAQKKKPCCLHEQSQYYEWPKIAEHMQAHT
jgi:hypothetical protein